MQERTFTATLDSLNAANAFLKEMLAVAGSSVKDEINMSVAFEEMFVNVANYAYPDSDGDVTVRIDVEGHKVTVTLIDSGIPYNPLAKEDPDVTLGADERPIGGLGIFMVKKMTDEVYYEHTDGKNIFTFVKEVMSV